MPQQPSHFAIPIIDLLLVTLGVMLLGGINPFLKAPQVRVPGASGPTSQAYLYGVFLGPIALPCAGPFLIATLAISRPAEHAFHAGSAVLLPVSPRGGLLSGVTATATLLSQLEAYPKAMEVIKQVSQEYGDLTGRYYDFCEEGQLDHKPRARERRHGQGQLGMEGC